MQPAVLDIPKLLFFQQSWKNREKSRWERFPLVFPILWGEDHFTAVLSEPRITSINEDSLDNGII